MTMSNRSVQLSRFAAALLVALPVVGAGMSTPAFAQQQEKKEEQATTQGNVLTERVFKQVTEANKAIEEKRYADAISTLDRILSREVTPYEKAVVLQTKGFALAEQEKLKEAAQFFEQALDLKVFAPDQQLNLVFNLAQIYLVTEQYQKSIAKYKEWFAQATNPQPQAYVAFANAYAQIEDYKNAIPLLETAIQKAGGDVKREWYDFLTGLYFQTGQFPKAADIVELLVTRYPGEKRYWTQLAGLYSELKREKEVLAIMEGAYKAGHLDKSTELVNLAQMWMFHGVPHRAATLVEQHIKTGKIDSNEKNWELLANAWVASREYDKSIDPLRRAAELGNNGENYVRLAQAFTESENWKEVVDALEKALAKGGLRNRGQVHLLEGVALYNLKRLEPARQAFLKASQEKDTQRTARSWLTHVEREQQREREQQEQAAAVQR